MADSGSEAFIPRRGLGNPHLQTLASYFLRRRSLLPPAETRLFAVEPEVEVLCHCHFHAEEEMPTRERMTLVILHGLEGSSESQYVVGVANKAWAAGMNVVRMNMRNCGGSHNLGPTLYHSGLSGDVGAVARALIEQDGLERIALAGFSMGGNLVLKLAGEWSREAPRQLKAVATVCAAMDLGPSADALHLPMNRVYEQNFLRLLKRSVRRKAELFPERYDLACLKGLGSLREFDDRVTARYCGFAGAEDYYTRSSSSRVLERIAVPALIVHAADDPFIRILPQTRQKLAANPHIRFLETPQGGHCAFLAAADGYDGRWAERRVVEFLKQGTE